MSERYGVDSDEWYPVYTLLPTESGVDGSIELTAKERSPHE